MSQLGTIRVRELSKICEALRGKAIVDWAVRSAAEVVIEFSDHTQVTIVADCYGEAIFLGIELSVKELKA